MAAKQKNRFYMTQISILIRFAFREKNRYDFVPFFCFLLGKKCDFSLARPHGVRFAETYELLHFIYYV